MHPTLQYGSRGGVVRAFQHLLNEVEHTHLGHRRDGIFGPRTRAAVIHFQTRERLEVDGIVGPHTWAAIGRALRLHDLAASASRAAAAQPKPVVPAAVPYARTQSSASRTMSASPVVTAPPKATVASPPRPVRRLVTAPHVSADLGGEGGPSWYQAGLAEFQAHHTIFGNRDSNQRIHEYFLQTSCHPAVGHKTKWCSAFVNWCMHHVGIIGTHNAMAVSWLNWGVELAEPRRGCVMVVHWSAGGNHVTFFEKREGGKIHYFGGNQGKDSRISHSSVPLSWIASVHYRWPSNG